MRRQTVMRIAIYAFDGITMFHLSVPQMVFDEVSRQGLAPWETLVFSDDAGPIRTAEGYEIGGLNGPQAAAKADIVVVPSWHDDGRPATAGLRRLLTREHDHGATVVGLCLGHSPSPRRGCSPVAVSSPIGTRSTSSPNSTRA